MAYLMKSVLAKLKRDLHGVNKQHDLDQSLLRQCMLLSKQSICASLKGNLIDAKKPLDAMKKQMLSYKKKSHKDGYINKMIEQEYAESAFIYHFVACKALPSATELSVEATSYFNGLCDFSGELVRYALNNALKKNKKEVVRVKEMLDELYDAAQGMILRGEMRKKGDRLRWDLERIADVLLKMNNG